MPCEDEGRGNGDAGLSQGMPKIASKPQASEEAWDTFSLSSQNESTCINRFLGSRNVT